MQNESIKKGVPLDIVQNEPNIVRLVTPEKSKTHASHLSPIHEKRLVKPSAFLLSPYMHKKTKVLPRICMLEFMLGNSLFAMQGETM